METDIDTLRKVIIYSNYPGPGIHWDILTLTGEDTLTRVISAPVDRIKGWPTDYTTQYTLDQSDSIPSAFWFGCDALGNIHLV